MSTPYSGNPQLSQIAVAIAGATNASPIVVQTATPHLFSTGDRVVPQLVGGNTAANCGLSNPWTIDVIDATHFSLRNSTGNGAYTSGGHVYNAGHLPPVTVPSDGDPPNASSFAPGYEGLADRSSSLALALLTGYAPIALYQQGTSDDTWTAWANATSSTGWGDVLNGVTHVGDLLRFDLNPPAPLVNHGDILVIGCELGMVAITGGDMALQIAVAVSSQLANVFTGTFGGAKRVVGGATVMPFTWNAAYKIFASSGNFAPGSGASVTAWDGTKATFTGLSGMSAQSVGDLITLYGAASAGNNQQFSVTDFISAGSVKGIPLGGLTPVSGDANNTNIHWAMQNMKFSVKLQNETIGSAGTYTMYGHRQMSVLHLRPPQVILL